MTIHQILFIITSIIIALLALLVMFLQFLFIKNLTNRHAELMRELRRVFGWDEYNWSDTFRDYSRTARTAKDKVEELYQLPLIKKALEAKQLEVLEKKKRETEKEIEKLEQGGRR